MFVEYAMRIRARSRSKHTLVFQLTNGVGSYLPTSAAVTGGSYSSKPASTLVGPEGGESLTEIFVTEINNMWNKQEAL